LHQLKSLYNPIPNHIKLAHQYYAKINCGPHF